MADGDGDQLTIDQLAHRTGMTVRNIRAHQSRGLLPPPEVRGRTGYYGREHVARIELIKDLQADGFSLDLIRRLLEGPRGPGEEALLFTRVLRAPFGDEEPELVTAAELVERWGDDPALLRRAEQLGILRPLGDGRYEALSPRLIRAGDELASLGVSAKQSLEVAARVRRHADSVAKVFVELFLKAVWEPFERAGGPEDRWPEVREALERVRPLASESLLSLFQLAMNEAVERAFGQGVERLTHHSRKR